MLAWRPLVFVGLISYSLYLWHRPLLVFVSYYRIEPLGAFGTIVVLSATVLLAVASWHLIEQPVRTRTRLQSPAALLAVMAAVSAAVLLAGVILWNSNGFPQRFSEESQLLFAEVAGSPRWLPCLEQPEERARTGQLCSTEAPAAAARVLVWGDSHALAMMPAYEVLARRYHERLYLAGKAFCPPLLPAAPVSPLPSDTPLIAANCAVFNAAVARQIARLDVRTVILDARWIDANLPAGVADIASGIEQTVQQIGSSRSVCVVLGVPALKYAPAYALVMARRRGVPADFLKLSRAQALAQFRDMEPALRALPADSRLVLADPKDTLCPAESCIYLANGRTLYYDDNHLSPDGARYVIPALERCFQAPAAPAARAAP
jgi:hypothetical protein